MINPTNNKLISIIDTFSKVELNRLSKFIESPYFNVNNDIILLYQKIISKFGKALEFRKEELWESIGNGKKFESLRLRKISSDLLKLVEQFLAQEVYESKKLLKANYLLQAAGQKDLKKLYKTSQTNAIRVSEQSAFRVSEFFLNQYLREKNIYEMTNYVLDRTSQSNVDQIIRNLDYFYLAEKMKWLCEIIMRENVISMEYDILFRDEIIEHLKKYKYSDIPLVAVYLQMYLTLQEDNDDNYFKFKQLLEKHIGIFPKDEAKEIYTAAINYCLKKANSGNSDFLLEFLELNETLLEKNIIAENELSPWKFKNIVTAGLKLSRFKWVEEFILTYKNKITEKYRDNAITFNTAQLFFYQKRYAEVLPILLQVDYEDFTYSINSRLFIVISYYELKEFEALTSFIDSFKIYLRRQKSITESRKQIYSSFLNSTKKLLRFKNFKKIDLLKMRDEILESNQIASKGWLLEKIDQLLYPAAKQRNSSDQDDPFQSRQNT